MTLYPLPTNLKFVFFFNTAAATLWFCCLARFLILLPLVGRKFLPGGIADFFHVVALLPLIGFLMVKTLVNKTFAVNDLWGLANGSRMAWICYGVIFPHPKIAKHTSYSLLILSWCLTYLVQFAYYAFKIKTRSSPRELFWLQYHLFYFTFPLGLVAEMILVFLSLEFVPDDSIYDFLLQAALLSYIPLGYFSWGHLQNRKKLKYDDVMEKRNQIRNRRTSTSPTAVSASAVDPEPQAQELRETH
ncbi:uncharacterized protein RJT20DRAFT_124194 [Scheffersomyces xylosifermentans]|uniref:uncharacterized protein n=1 Tax=Scheffersomyces xylosifermentans TaxID=1304137 RepID=UPI00315D32C7